MTEKQKQELKKLKKAGEFRQGRAGCESRLYEVRGYFEGTMSGTEFLELDEEAQRKKFDVLKVAANDVHEVLDYVRRWEEGFDVREIALDGLIIMLSGSPHH